MIHVGNNVRRIRKSKDLTQAEVAARLKLPRERISSIESRSSVTTKTLELLAKGLGVEPFEILINRTA